VNDRGRVGIVVFKTVDHSAIGKRSRCGREPVARAKDGRRSAGAIQRGSRLEIGRAGAGRGRCKSDADCIE
jgi:hypothetical protein